MKPHVSDEHADLKMADFHFRQGPDDREEDAASSDGDIVECTLTTPAGPVGSDHAPPIPSTEDSEQWIEDPLDSEDPDYFLPDMPDSSSE